MEKQYENIFDILGALGALDVSEKITLKLKETKMAQTKITTGSFIIGSVTPGVGVSFSRNPVEHFSAADARAECERLARMNPGKTFFFVEVKGGAYIPSPTLTKF